MVRFHDVRILCCFPDFWSRFSLTSVWNVISFDFWKEKLKLYIKYHYDSQKYYISGFGIELFGPMPGAKYSKNRIKCCDNFTGKYLSKIQKKILVCCVIFWIIFYKGSIEIFRFISHFMLKNNLHLIFLSSNSNSKKILVVNQLVMHFIVKIWLICF